MISHSLGTLLSFNCFLQRSNENLNGIDIIRFGSRNTFNYSLYKNYRKIINDKLRYSQEDFEEMCILKHNNEYSYDEFIYKDIG